ASEHRYARLRDQDEGGAPVSRGGRPGEGDDALPRPRDGAPGTGHGTAGQGAGRTGRKGKGGIGAARRGPADDHGARAQVIRRQAWTSGHAKGRPRGRPLFPDRPRAAGFASGHEATMLGPRVRVPSVAIMSVVKLSVSPDEYLRGILERDAIDASMRSPLRRLQADIAGYAERALPEGLLGVHPTGAFERGTGNRSSTAIDFLVSYSPRLARSARALSDAMFVLFDQLG